MPPHVHIAGMSASSVCLPICTSVSPVWLVRPSVRCKVYLQAESPRQKHLLSLTHDATRTHKKIKINTKLKPPGPRKGGSAAEAVQSPAPERGEGAEAESVEVEAP